MFRKLFIKLGCLLIISSFSLSMPAYCDSVWPTMYDWKRSFIESITSPVTWLPLTGAAVIYATNSDKSISNWASSHTPIFGSQSNAENASDRLRDALGYLALGTIIFMPSEQTGEKWYIEKGRLLLVESAGTALSSGVTEGLKNLVKRERPNHKDCKSFPSQHATQAFSFAAISTRNIDNYDISPGGVIAWDIGIYTMASLTGWARIEAKEHYPTDVLVGAAIGNFFTSLVYHAFVKRPKTADELMFSITPERDGAAINIGKSF